MNYDQGRSQSPLMTSSKTADYPPPDTGKSQQNTGNKLQIQVLSNFVHLECTNLVATSTVRALSLTMLQDVLVKTLEQINVDIVEFVACPFLVSH